MKFANAISPKINRHSTMNWMIPFGIPSTGTFSGKRAVKSLNAPEHSSHRLNSSTSIDKSRGKYLIIEVPVRPIAFPQDDPEQLPSSLYCRRVRLTGPGKKKRTLPQQLPLAHLVLTTFARRLSSRKRNQNLALGYRTEQRPVKERQI